MTARASSGSSTRCRQCGKAIVWPGLCYTCATGLPRLLRPREDGVGEGEARGVAASEPQGGPG